MANMGLSRLVLADPASWDRTQARRVATEAASLLDSAVFLPTLEEAIDRSTFVIATSARRRKGFSPLGPKEAAHLLIEEARRKGAPSIVFGDERSGLPRWVLDRAHRISTIPTSPGFTSLNLAQSVLLFAYELREAAEGGQSGEPPREIEPAEPASSQEPPRDRRPASIPESDEEVIPRKPGETPMSAEDLARLRERARALLLQAGYLNPQQPNRILGELERLLVRAGPNEREGKLLLALVRQLEWAVGAGAKDR